MSFSFWYRPNGAIESVEKNKAYAEIVYRANGAWQTPVTSDMVKPTDDSKWWHGLVYASLPTNMEQVKV